MGKGFLVGIVWGTVSCLLVVVAVSLNAPLPGPAASNVDAPEGSEFSRPAVDPELVVPVVEAPKLPERPAVVLTDAPAIAAPTADAPVSDSSSAQVDTPVQEIAGIEGGLDRGARSSVSVELVTPTPEPALPDLSEADQNVLAEALELAEAAVDEAEGLSDAQTAPEPEATAPEPVVLPEPTEPVIEPEEPIEIAEPVVAPEAAAPSPVVEQPEETAPIETPAAPTVVTTGRLPSISAEPAGQLQTPSVFSGALARNALRLDLEPGLPLFSIVLIDQTDTGLPVAEIAGLPVPVAVAIDAGTASAAQVADGYRATGHEVLILAEDLPLDGNEADLSLAVTDLLAKVPSAVGLLLPPGSELARNRAAMDQVAAILARTGHGVVEIPQGLDPAGQAAAAANVPVAKVFRVLDGADEGVPLMVRYMDRAAFEASRAKSVVVMGTIQPNTLNALLSWVDGRRASTVAVAPVSAIMLQ